MGVRYRAQLTPCAVNVGRVHRDPDHHGTEVDALVDLSGHEARVVDEKVARDLEDAVEQFRLARWIDSPNIDKHG